MDLKEMGLVDPWSHWYYLSKARLLHRLILPYRGSCVEIVDVGAGSGFFSAYLAGEIPINRVTLVDPGYADVRPDLSRFSCEVNVLLTHDDIDQPVACIVLMIDVLEHIEDDRGFLAEVLQRIPRGSSILVSVPAHAWLWSGHDDFLGHKRRYRLQELVEISHSQEIQVVYQGYLFQLLLPIALLARRLSPGRSRPESDLRSSGFLVNLALRTISSRCPRILGRLPGLSAVVVLRKDNVNR